MCGVAGILNFESRPFAERVGKMCSYMEHRGPDNQSVVSYGPCVLGHRRLSIIDLTEQANQPLEKGHLALVFNGEIYNFKELRTELLEQGGSFQTVSDTEVIIEGFRVWGIEMLCKKLGGMFSFALWDKKSGKLSVARDRFGEKPFYYSQEGNNFVFSSNASTITKTSPLTYSLSSLGLTSYLQLGYCISPFQIFEGMEVLPEGCFAEISITGIRVEKYWDLNRNDKNYSFSESLEKTEELLRKSVEQQMIADVPLGCLLSGGVDSTLIASMATELNPNMHLFTVRMPNSALDESKIASETAKQIGGIHKVIDAQPVELSDFYKFMGQFPQPLGDASALGVWMVAREAKKVVSVVLTGDGGDEFFEGYNTVPLHESLRGKRNFLTNSVGSGLAKLISYLSSPFADQGLVRKARTFLNLVTTSHKNYHTRKSLIPNRLNLIQKKDGGSNSNLEVYLSSLWDESPILNDRYSQAYYDIKTDLPGDYLMKVDTATMAHSLEARAPFLDHNLANFAFNLPIEQKYYGNTSKGILKVLLKKRVGERIYKNIIAEKRGFVLPIDEWFEGKWSELASQLSSSPLIDDGYLNARSIELILKSAKKIPLRYSRIRYSLVALDSWYRQNG